MFGLLIKGFAGYKPSRLYLHFGHSRFLIWEQHVKPIAPILLGLSEWRLVAAERDRP